MAKETYYFSHDSNALIDTKILNMRAEYGLEGYGLYWVIIEMMRNEEEYKLELNKNTYRAIKILTNTNIDIEKFIKDCIEDYELFKQDNEQRFYSKSLLKRMEVKEKKSEIAREKANKRWNKNAEEMQKQCSSNANKIKENKIKENKENKTKEIVNDSCVDGLQKIVEFYENNIGLLSPYGREIMEDYAKEMPEDLIILAIKKAVEANIKTIQYIKGILNNWSKKQIKTVIEAQMEDEKFRKQNTYQEESEEEKLARKLKELEGG